MAFGTYIPLARLFSHSLCDDLFVRQVTVVEDEVVHGVDEAALVVCRNSKIQSPDIPS